MTQAITDSEKQSLSEFATSLIERARKINSLNPTGEQITDVQDPDLYAQLMIKVNQQERSLALFMNEFSVQLNRLDAKVQMLSTSVDKLAGTLDGLNDERHNLLVALATSKNDLQDFSDSILASVSNLIEKSTQK